MTRKESVISQMCKRFAILILVYTVAVSGQTFQLSSSCGGSVHTGGSCTLTCTTSAAGVSWNIGGDTYTQTRSSCSSTSGPLPTDYTSACTSTTYTITFTNARYNRDNKTWKCRNPFGSGDSNSNTIDVQVSLTSVSLTRTTTSITCAAVSNPRPSISLYRDGVSVATSPAAVEGNNGWTATLNYQLTGDSNNYVYWCQASNTQTSVNSTFSLPQIPVTSMTLRNITINDQEVGAAEGQPLTLTCVTSASYPAGSVTWYKNNVQVTSGISINTQITSGVAVVTTSSVTFNSPTRSDLGQLVFCTATNQHTSSPPQSNRARLGVWFGPEQVAITPLNTPAIADRDLTLTCTVTAHPAPTFTWNYSDGSSTVGSTGSVTPVSGSTSRWSQTLTFRPNRNKLTVRCRTTNTETSVTQDDATTLDVKYPPPGSPNITRFTSPMLEGDTGETVTCSVTGGKPLASLNWTCPGTGTPADSTSGQTVTSTLTFTVTRGQNGQQCRCQGSWQYGGYSQSDVRTFYVSYPPSKPIVTVNPVVCEGQPVSLGCSSSDPGNPAATYTWTKNDNSVSPGFSPVRTDNGATIRCTAGNIFTDRPGYTALQSDPKTITVHYAPAITIEDLTTGPLKEGVSLFLTCVSDSNPDTSDSDIKWVFDGVETQGPGLQKSDISRHDHGVYMCTATVNSATCGTQQGHRNVTVIVNYAPNVTLTGAAITEGQSLVIVCQAEGRPATYTFRRFIQYWGDTDIQTRGGQQTADTYTLRIDTASYLDSGMYECGVDNNITDRNSVLVQRKKVNVSVRAKPKFTRDSKLTYGAEVGSSVTLYTTFLSRENCTYNWTFSGQSSNTKNAENLLVTRVTLDVYAKVIQDDGWNVTLTLTSFQERDIGVYTVVVCNSVGCNSTDINLMAAGPPLVPLDFLVINVTEATIVLRWKPNFSGGDFTQMFILQYRKVGQSTWTTEEKEDDHQEFVYAKISGLTQGTKYEFRVRAKNSRDNNNEGHFTGVITQQTLGVLPQPSSNQLGAIVGSVIGVLAVCVLIICAVILCRRGYRCVNKNADSPNISREPQEKDNTAYASVDSTEILPGNTYDRLENTPSEEYTRLKLYQNMKGQGTDTVDYENLKSKGEQLDYDSVELHTYENAVRKESSNPDPTYVNRPKP